MEVDSEHWHLYFVSPPKPITHHIFAIFLGPNPQAIVFLGEDLRRNQMCVVEKRNAGNRLKCGFPKFDGRAGRVRRLKSRSKFREKMACERRNQI